MDIRISPSVLGGELSIPASKSCAHRSIICAALADGVSHLSGVTMSKDIEATIGAMRALGAEFVVSGRDITVKGTGGRHTGSCLIDCNESGSTLRFILPIAAAVSSSAEFIGRGRLPQRPIDIFVRELGRNGTRFDYHNTMPFTVSGGLNSGVFKVEGDVSSQFITGLLFALPLLEGDSEIVLTSHLESRPYVDITIDTLRRFGISAEESVNGFRIKGGQRYLPNDERIEGDYSQAAFFYVANALGSQVELHNLNENSVQGDRKILEIIRNMCYNGSIGHYDADCSDIPDLVPVLAVLGAFGSGDSRIYNAKRLKIKESDRLQTTAAMINALGGNVDITDDGLIIHPTGAMHGGTVDSSGDHRIAMAAAVAATRTDGDVIIRGAEAVEKSYPAFFDDYKKLGGKANVIILE
ncbi:3-phosphoshikimate 1-carboxyvinyltransferase [uncultured Ruminococcus sp.]|uniref:3-phosphoshikimate 1-carboxyvinyltransferase n=1 Tax=uncultured Ruminococcus sp. TaxID=165186 RepID=UPI002638C6E0|nr:3-phosphoshikimate 1-carboxyvinyltransferase [uncultured Ruminococcus sp.]